MFRRLRPPRQQFHVLKGTDEEGTTETGTVFASFQPTDGGITKRKKGMQYETSTAQKSNSVVASKKWGVWKADRWMCDGELSWPNNGWKRTEGRDHLGGQGQERRDKRIFISKRGVDILKIYYKEQKNNLVNREGTNPIPKPPNKGTVINWPPKKSRLEMSRV